MRRGGRSKTGRRPTGSAEPVSSVKSGKSDPLSPATPPPRTRSKQNRLRKAASRENQFQVKEGRRRAKSGFGSAENERKTARKSAEKTAEDPYSKDPYAEMDAAKFWEKEKKYSYVRMEQMSQDVLGKKEEKKELRQSQIGSVFEPISGPSIPARSGVNGVKNKMKWKIDVEPVALRGDQKMAEILEKLRELRKSSGMKPCKVLKANEQMMSSSDEEPTEEGIYLSARILQMVKMEALIKKEISKEEQDVLRGFCRCGDQKEKAETIFETITCSILEKMASKNEFIRHVSIPGQLRLFAVDERKSKFPMMALLIVRKDLFYYAWTKPSTPDDDEQLDQTWSSMTYKCYTVQAPTAAPTQQGAPVKSAHFQPYY